MMQLWWWKTSPAIWKGDKPLTAALKGAGEIGFTIISLTFSLIAVLIPLLFMGISSGRLFREFAITLCGGDPDFRVWCH